FIFFNNYYHLHLFRQFLQESHSSFINFQNLFLHQLICNVFELSIINFNIIIFFMLLILESTQKNSQIKLLIKISFFKNCAELILLLIFKFINSSASIELSASNFAHKLDLVSKFNFEAIDTQITISNIR